MLGTLGAKRLKGGGSQTRRRFAVSVVGAGGFPLASQLVAVVAATVLRQMPVFSRATPKTGSQAGVCARERMSGAS